MIFERAIRKKEAKNFLAYNSLIMSVLTVNRRCQFLYFLRLLYKVQQRKDTRLDRAQFARKKLIRTSLIEAIIILKVNRLNYEKLLFCVQQPCVTITKQVF